MGISQRDFRIDHRAYGFCEGLVVQEVTIRGIFRDGEQCSREVNRPLTLCGTGLVNYNIFHHLNRR